MTGQGSRLFVRFGIGENRPPPAQAGAVESACARVSQGEPSYRGRIRKAASKARQGLGKKPKARHRAPPKGLWAVRVAGERATVNGDAWAWPRDEAAVECGCGAVKSYVATALRRRLHIAKTRNLPLSLIPGRCDGPRRHLSRRLFGTSLDSHVRQPLQPLRQIPVQIAQQRHARRHQHRPNDRRIQ